MAETDLDRLRNIPIWDPPATLQESTEAWERYAENFLNHDLPQIGEYHEQVNLTPELHADIAVPLGTPPFPIVLYLHGGGWAFGSAKSFRKVSMTFAAHGVLAITPNYRLAPEHPFPSALDDISQALDWIINSAATYGADRHRISIGGDSAGANLAFATAIRSPESIRKQLSSLLLFYGAYDLAATIERSDYQPGVIEQVNNYAGQAGLSDPLVSPLLNQFPPSTPACFLLEGSADQLVGGESAALAVKLKQANINHEFQIMDNMPHGFMQFFELEGCQMAWERMIAFLRRQPPTHSE